jgi:hypothetical protein
MAEDRVLELVRNVDARLARVEQFLPTLATRAETHAAIQAATVPLATREEVHAAIQAATAPLATREEMHAAIQAATAPLATREEMHAAILAATASLATRAELEAAVAPLATRAELHTMADDLRDAIRQEGERSRRYTDVLVEDLRDDNRLILEHLIALSARVDALAQH